MQNPLPFLRVGLTLLILVVLAGGLLAFMSSADGGAIAGSKEAETVSGGQTGDQTTRQQSAVSSTAVRATRLRVGEREGVTTIMLQLSRQIDYRVFALSAPTKRLVIDTDRVEFRFDEGDNGRIEGDGMVQQVRFAHKSPTQSRFVMDLSQAVTVADVRFRNSIGGPVLQVDLLPSSDLAFASLEPIEAGLAATAAAATAHRPVKDPL